MAGLFPRRRAAIPVCPSRNGRQAYVAGTPLARDGGTRRGRAPLIYQTWATPRGDGWSGYRGTASSGKDLLERVMRFELTTSTLARLRSTPELHPHPWVRREI